MDRGQIRQVLLNIFVNAGQAMPSGGRLTLTTRNTELTSVSASTYQIPPGRYVQIFISDTGHGMDRQTQSRIFDPFFTTKEIGRGTGLGLASAYGILKNHNGCIDVYSEPGMGTTFTISLPATSNVVLPEPNVVVSDTPLPGQGTILLVDDEQMIIEVARDMLQAIGYQVVTAGNGSEALKIFAADSRRFAAVIIDMIMPDMDGGEVFDRLREIDPRVRVILSSGYSLNDKAADIMQRGCLGFLQKPFDLNLLSRKLRQVINQTPTADTGEAVRD